jgi:vacuolar-type H+-ATPase subunit E/Vma4
LIENAGTIAKTIGVLFALSTMVKTVSVLIGIGKVAVALYTWAMAQLTAGTALATTATTLFSTAMRLIPFVAVLSGLALTIDYFNKSKTAIENTLPALSDFETDSLAAANTASRFTPYLTVFRLIAIEVLKATGVLDDFIDASQIAANPASPNQAANRARRNAAREANRAAGRIGGGSGFVMPNFEEILSGGGSAAASSLQEELDKLAREAEKAAQDAADAMSQIEAEAQAERERLAAAEQAVLDKRENAYKSFTDSVKSLFGQIKDSILSSFNLPTLGNSVNSITRNIGKLLEKTKGFASDITQLSGLGLNSALLQQVIQAGPVAGSRLASAIVGGGSAFISQLNSAYGEMGNLASGIAGVGTGSAFANQAVVNNYNIEVNGGVGSGPTIGKAIVDAIKSYERTSGAVWQGA